MSVLLSHAIVNGVYLLVVLHLLLLLTILSHSAVAASLLAVFVAHRCTATSAGDSDAADEWSPQQQPPQLQQQWCLDATVFVDTEAEAHSAGRADDGADTEVFVSTLYGAHEPLTAADGRGRRGRPGVSPFSLSLEHSPDAAASLTREQQQQQQQICSGGRRFNPPVQRRDGEGCAREQRMDASAASFVELNTPTGGGVDDTLAYPALASDVLREAVHKADLAATCDREGDDSGSAKMPRSRLVAQTPPLPPAREPPAAAHYLAPGSAWVLAAAVATSAAACASAVVFALLHGTEERRAGAPGVRVLPGWVTDVPAAAPLLVAFVGVPLDYPAAARQFWWSAASHSVVGLASWCLLLHRVLHRIRAGRRRRSEEEAATAAAAAAAAAAGHGRVLVTELWSASARRATRLVTTAPFSLALVGVAGIGQGTVLGLLSLVVVLVVLSLLLSPAADPTRSPQRRSSDRQRVWTLYTCALLCLWEAQMILRLTPVQDALASTRVWSQHPHWFTALIGAAPSTSDALLQRWYIIHAVGLWWAGVERFCGYTATCAASEEARVSGRLRQRARLLCALAVREQQQWSRAINQQRAAHGKLQQLRLERHAPHHLLRPSRGSSADGRLRQRRCGRVWTCRDAVRGALHRHECAPFGSGGSHCCWLDKNSIQHLACTGSGSGGGGNRSPRLSVGSPCTSTAARARERVAEWDVSAVVRSPLCSGSSVYGVLGGRRAPWQRSELASAWTTPVHSDAESCAEVRMTTAVACDSTTAAVPEPQRHAWPGSPRAPTRSPCRGGAAADTDGAVVVGYVETTTVAASAAESLDHRRSAAPSLSGAQTSCVFSVATSGPRAGAARVRGTAHTHALPRKGSIGSISSISGYSRWSSIAAGSPADIVVEAPAAPPHSDTVHASPLAAVPCAETRSTTAAQGWRDSEGGHSAASAPEAASVLGRVGARVQRLAHRLRCYLHRHTASSAEDSTGAADVAVLWRLVVLYVAQSWSCVCALLLLIHFAVCGTVATLAPSIVSVTYALQQRPWPCVTYWRLQLLASALLLLLKGVTHVYLVTAAPYVKWTICWWVNVLLLRVDALAEGGDVPASGRSLSPPVATLSGGWCHYTWVDLALSGGAVAALAIQWATVFPDHRVWQPPTRGAGEDAPPAILTPAAVPAAADSVACEDGGAPAPRPRRGVAELWRSCRRRLRHWNSYRCGAGADFYAVQLFFDGLSLLLFGVAYYAIVPAATATSDDNLLLAVRHNRLPGIFVATALGLVVHLFVERILYVLQARVAKCALHCLLAAVYHALYVLWRTAQESSSGVDGASSFSSSSSSSAALTASVSLLLTTKLASLWCSALQLRYGYALHRLHDPFTVSTDMLHWLGHVIFRATPFLMELRVLLDWSFSATTLKVQHWMLLEDVHHTVYRRFVDMHDLRHTNHRQGHRFPYGVRLYQGVLGFATILLVLFFPLFWYSTFSPQVRASHVVAWASEITLAGMSTVPLFSADAVVQQSSFHAATTPSRCATAAAPVRVATLLRLAAATDTWQTVRVATCSGRVLSYTPAAMQDFLERLGGGGGGGGAAAVDAGAATIVLRHRVTRARATEATLITVHLEHTYTLSPTSRTLFADALRTWQSADKDADAAGDAAAAATPVVVPLASMYTPYVLSSGSGVSLMAGAATRGVDCRLTVHRTGRYHGFFCVECADGSPSSTSEQDSAAHGAPPRGEAALSATATATAAACPLTFVVASRDVVTAQSGFSLIPNIGIVALYTSFVLVMSSYIRNYFAGDAHRVVLLQLANPEPVAELLRYLYLARSSANDGQVGDLVLEQLLFLELLDLLRSPERLLKLGGRRVDDYADSTYRRALFDATRRPFAIPDASDSEQRQPPPLTEKPPA
ncbi:hypothetical protein NESM_000139100 [Novymonas esmeraldas]|uniref:Piezo non-specific cation channel R-Ras-binding domain-containing protein n=1 Tax=Novymonas esmeraldas TaxID=1808958 RepID=A0AAW0F2M9_9TRYP